MRSPVAITAPNSDVNYSKYAQSAVVAGQLYLFSGDGDNRKIAKLDSCALTELEVKLNMDFTIGHAAVSTANGSKAIICFAPSPPYNYCDAFDGSIVTPSHKTTYPHLYGCLGLYNGQPTTVGGSNVDYTGKVETLGQDGWTSLSDCPVNFYTQNLVGMDNGDLVLLGGRNIDEGNNFEKSVWRLRNSTWFMLGSLDGAVGYGSALTIDSSIFIFAGENGDSTFPLQRVDISEDGTIDTQIIGDQGGKYLWPVMFTDSSNCTTVEHV
ncbi:unnamed protein product [Oikopleura dioica]|uniref:Uncharacterized protein n=1 Tax=Oikopleura dioica TaxID=34765 RepID=E4YMW8_OIKDI|nr:unnamed protein product [Oikopleura dioica]